MSPRPRRPGRKDLQPNLYAIVRKGVTYYQYKDIRTGKFHGMGTDKTQANDDAAALNAAIYTARRQRRIAGLEKATGQTLRSYLPRYWNLITVNPRQSLAANTLRSRAYIVDQIRQHANSAVPLEAIEVLHVGEIVSEYQSRGKQRMAQAVRAVLVDVFRYAIAEGLRPIGMGNPAEASLKPVAKVKRSRLTFDEFRAIYEAAKRFDPWVRNSMALAITTTQRRDDLSRLRFKDVIDDRLYIVQGKTDMPLRVKTAIRLEAFGMSIGDAIKQCRDRVVSPYLLHHTRRTNKSRPGDAVHRDTLSRRFQDSRKAAGIESDHPPTFHEIRSLAARMYKAEGFNPQLLMGHKDASTTDVYCDARGHEWVEVG